MVNTTLNLGGKEFVFAPVKEGDQFPKLITWVGEIEVKSLRLWCGTTLTNDVILKIIADKIQRN